ncbi:MAG: OmpA family protein [Thermodesulfobacteriota bacterium]
MMAKEKIGSARLVVGLLLFFSFLVPVGAPCLAGECDGIVAELARLTGLLERRDFLEKVIGRCPEDHRLHYAYGQTMERLRRYDEALLAYRKAVEIKPDCAEGYLAMGEVYLCLGKNDEALALLDQGLSLDPHNIWGKRSYARACRLIEKVGDRIDEAADPVTVSSPVPQLPAHPAPEKMPAGAPSASGGIPPAVPAMIASSAVIVSIRFPSRGNELSAEAAAELQQAFCSPDAAAMFAADRFEIAGHTDDNGDIDHNMLLSRVRAEKVRDYLVKRCQIAPERLTVIGHGSTQPVVANDSRDHRRMNRRVEIRRIGRQP